jgi:transcriptional regulator with XRE-family HTH domain
MDVKQALGARIKELRKKLNYTQEQFAEKIGVAPRHISRIENGVNTPSVETLEKIAIVLGVEIKDLFNFQHLKSENHLKEEMEEIIKSLQGENLSVAYKILSVLVK